MDFELLEQIKENEDVLDYLDASVLLNHLDEEDILKKANEIIHYDNYDGIMAQIRQLVMSLKPKGYIDKDEAKRLICEYIDTFYIKSFE